MTEYKHKIKPIPAYRDAPTVPAPAVLGQPRHMLWIDIFADVRMIGFLQLALPDMVEFHATNQSWPRGGGRAIVIAGSGEILEVWSLEQLTKALNYVVPLATAERVARQVWVNPLRADPKPWPSPVRLIEFK